MLCTYFCLVHSCLCVFRCDRFFHIAFCSACVEVSVDCAPPFFQLVICPFRFVVLVLVFRLLSVILSFLPIPCFPSCGLLVFYCTYFFSIFFHFVFGVFRWMADFNCINILDIFGHCDKIFTIMINVAYFLI